MKPHQSIPIVLALSIAFACLALLPQSAPGQPAALPKSPGAALRSGWQIAHFAVGYAPLPKVATGSGDWIDTSFGTDEVHYYLLRKEGSYILCYAQLVMRPGAMRYEPWKHECMAIG